MKADMPLVRIDLYLRETTASIIFLRKTDKPRRSFSAGYPLSLSQFSTQLERLIYRYGNHKFNILSTGTWVYSWEFTDD